MTGRFEHFDARSGGSYRVPGVALPDARINATSLAVHVSSGIRVPIEADAPDIRWTNYNTSDLVRLVETRTRSGMRMPSSPELIEDRRRGVQEGRFSADLLQISEIGLALPGCAGGGRESARHDRRRRRRPADSPSYFDLKKSRRVER
jgi:hypothetical protein